MLLRTSLASVLQRKTHFECFKTVYNAYSIVCAADAAPIPQCYPAGWETAKKFEEIPGPKPIPILGNAWRILKDFDLVRLAADMHREYGEIVNVRKLTQLGDMLFLFDVNDIQYYMRNEGQWPIRDGLESHAYYRHALRGDIFKGVEGLVSGQNEQWGSFRKAVNPILMQPRATHQYIPHINEISDEFLVRLHKLNEKYAGEMPDNFIEELNKWAFESIGVVALDTRLGCLEDVPSDRARRAIDHVLESFPLFLKLDYMPLGKLHKKFNTKTWQKFVKGQDYFTNLGLELLDKADERIKNDADYRNKPEHCKSIFEKLVAKDKSVALVMILDMLGAGIDTTAKAVGAALYHLAKHPEPQSKLRDELKRLLPAKNTPLTRELLDEAKYLRASIKESLRISPIVSGNLRRADKPIIIRGYQIPPGTLIQMPHLYLSSTSDRHFSNPKKFMPERWLRNVKTETVHPFTSMPFGFGARSCIGQRMAKMETEVILAKIIRNFELDWKHKDMTFKQELLYGIADPLKLSLKKVDN